MAAYGTLRPGEMNHGQLDGLEGRWLRGTVRGRLVNTGWGSAVGFLGLVLDPSGPEIDVWVFESLDLPANWQRLDEFEGDGYTRIATAVSTPDGERTAYIYVVSM